MSSFRKTLDEFRGDLKSQAARTGTPTLQSILDGERPARSHALRWVAAAMLAVTLGSIPLYLGARQRAREEQERADTRLWEQVNAGLSRSAPRAFDALLTTGN